MILTTFFIIFTCFILLKISSLLAFHLKLLDYPNNRKIHARPTPYVGGITLSVIYISYIFIFSDLEIGLKSILVSCFFISIIGFVDDKLDINPYLKIFLQSLPIFFLISNEIYLKDLGSYHPFGILSLGNYGKIFTFLSYLLIVNAFNYCDGVDALLSTLCINIISFFTLILFINSEITIIPFLYYLIVPLVIFIFFNFAIFNLPKIFLGDSGSNLMGLLIGSLMIYLYIEFNLDPSLLIWPVAYIIYEFLGTNIIRIINKKNLFKSGNDHFHYQISKKFKLNSFQLNLLINLLNAILSIIGISVNLIFGSLISLILFIILFKFYLFFKLSFVK